MRQAKHVRRELTDSERQRVSEARRLVEQDESELRNKVSEYKAEYDAAQTTLQDALQLLKGERLRQGLSVDDIQHRIGDELPNITKLEDNADANPSIAVLRRYAEALGKKLVITLADTSAS